MSLRDFSAIGKTGFKFEDKDFHDSAAIATTKLGTRTLSVPLEVAGASFSGASVAAAADGIFQSVLLPDANTGSIFFSFALPANYDSGQPSVDIYWKTTAITGNVRFSLDIAFKTTGETTALDVTQTSTVAAATVANQVTKTSITFSGLTITAGDIVGLTVSRLPADAADTLATNIYVIGAVVFNYTGRG